jgi:predicted transcriptional regulator
MAGPSKPAPLDTFLTSVSESGSSAPEPERTPDRNATLGGGQVVILTILSKKPESVPNHELMEQSELGADRFQRTIDELAAQGLIDRDHMGYRLTSTGREVAERERARLLSLW